MKIEIEWNSSTEGVIRIEGKELKVSLGLGSISMAGLSETQCECTLGGMIAEELYSTVGGIMQAHAHIEEHFSPGEPMDVAWKKLPPHLADIAYNLIT